MIYFFTKADKNTPSSRRRVYYLSEYMKKFGYESKIVIPTHRPWWNLSADRFKELWTNIRIYAGITRKDIIYLHRPIYQVDFMIIALFFRIFFNKKYIFDFDDPIFVHSPVKTYIMTRLASRVVIGGYYLYNYAKRLNKHVQIIPMLVDKARIEPGHEGSIKGEVLNIGWVGVADNHRENLKLIADVLREIAKHRTDFQFTLVGAGGDREIYQMFDIPNLKTRIIDWMEPENVNQEILKFDIALMPLLDTPWNLGKCPIKNIEYMQYGIPTVASNVGEATYLIKSDENGILADNDVAAWVAAIERLMNDPALRKDMSIKAQQTIKDSYSYQAYISAYLNLFEQYQRAR